MKGGGIDTSTFPRAEQLKLSHVVVWNSNSHVEPPEEIHGLIYFVDANYRIRIQEVMNSLSGYSSVLKERPGSLILNFTGRLY